MKTPAEIRRAIAHWSEAAQQCWLAEDEEGAIICKAIVDFGEWVLGDNERMEAALSEFRGITERN